MYQIVQFFKDAFRKCDKTLLLLCLVTNAFGCLMIASATSGSASGPFHYLIIQGGAAIAGVFIFVLFSSIDASVFSEHRQKLVIFNVFLLLLQIPFGTDNGTGNKSWLNFPFLPFDIQPAEICKILFVLILASVMASKQNNLSSPRSVAHMGLHLLLVFGLNMVVSGDMGVSLIFVFIFLFMTIAGGVSWLWYGGGAGTIAVAGPLLWNYYLDGYQRNRILVLFDSSLDPAGTGARYHTVRALRSLTGGGMTGQGLFNGNRTQRNLLFAQHTDFIFCAIGEELGFLGCLLVIVMLFVIIGRCIWVGTRTQDYLRKLICYGASGALAFQVIVNVGMCLDIMPVIGLTLPFVSYGGSSLITLYALMGLVSGVYARPVPPTYERYIRMPLKQYK